MLNFLNAVKLFGNIYDWNTIITIVCLIIAQVVLIVCALLAIVFILRRRTSKSEQKPEEIEKVETNEAVDESVR